MKDIGIGVIGLGFMGESYARILESLRGVELMAVADVDKDKGEQVAAATSASFYEDYKDILRDEAVEGVVVALPDQLHLSATVDTLAADKHLLLEKPLATTASDVDRILDATRNSEKVKMVGQLLRYDPRYAQGYEAIQNGTVGELIHTSSWRRALYSSGRRINGRTSLLYYLGVHEFDLLNWYTGSQVETVYAKSRSLLHRDLGVDDTILVTLEFENGCIGQVELTWSLPDSEPAKLDAGIKVVGTKGSFSIDMRDQGLEVINDGRSTYPDTMAWPILHDKQVGDLKYEIEHWIYCISEGREPLTPLEAGAASTRVALAVEESLRTDSPCPAIEENRR